MTSDQLFVIFVEIFAKPLKSTKMPFVLFDIVILPPGHGFWSFPIFAHYIALQYVVQGNLWIIDSVKNLFGF